MRNACHSSAKRVQTHLCAMRTKEPKCLCIIMPCLLCCFTDFRRYICYQRGLVYYQCFYCVLQTCVSIDQQRLSTSGSWRGEKHKRICPVVKLRANAVLNAFARRAHKGIRSVCEKSLLYYTLCLTGTAYTSVHVFTFVYIDHYSWEQYWSPTQASVPSFQGWRIISCSMSTWMISSMWVLGQAGATCSSRIYI